MEAAVSNGRDRWGTEGVRDGGEEGGATMIWIRGGYWVLEIFQELWGAA